jgi:hypothetical protein
MIRLVQIQNGKVRRVALVEEPQLRVLEKFESVYALASEAIAKKANLSELAQKSASGEKLDYEAIYQGKSDWKLLPPMDHPGEPARSLVSGTGLTHFGSAKNRQAMHEKKAEEETDSMKMFRWGMESGRPAAGKVGIPPEWFYKGNGAILRAHGEPLEVPDYAEDGGEEAEMVGVYLIGPDGQPHRVGFSPGNEFADHKFEKKNYLNLAGSKIRTCSFGPEIVIGAEFKTVPGKATIERAGKVLWSKDIATGEAEMTHSLANIEHHHFKFETHRRPGDVHVHYFGAHSLSFGDKVELADGDVMEVSYPGFGRPLRNSIKIVKGPESLVSVKAMA